LDDWHLHDPFHFDQFLNLDDVRHYILYVYLNFQIAHMVNIYILVVILVQYF
jgi:hypothetical protein